MEIEGSLLAVGLCSVSAITQEPNENPMAFLERLKEALQKFTTSILWRSAFFTVQLLHPYVTTGKTIALTRLTFVGKVMILLFNMLSRIGCSHHLQ